MTCSIGPLIAVLRFVPRPACVRVPGVHQRFFSHFLLSLLASFPLKSSRAPLSAHSTNVHPNGPVRGQQLRWFRWYLLLFFFVKWMKKTKKKYLRVVAVKTMSIFPFIYLAKTHTHTQKNQIFFWRMTHFPAPPPPPVRWWSSMGQSIHACVGV